MAHGRVSQAVDNDPSSVFGGILTLLGAGISLLVAFGVELTPEQATAILGFTTAAGPFVTAFLIRRKAWSPESHWQMVKDMAVDLEEESYNAVEVELGETGTVVGTGLGEPLPEIGGTPPGER
ncbi:MAG: hypothetical protein M3N32_07820 [Actinomycetota bacterium]|nr:hypothetical protein [Actinomycetota bacterium]